MQPIDRTIISRSSSAAFSTFRPSNFPQENIADDLSIVLRLLNCTKHPGVMTSFTDTSFDPYDLEGLHDQSETSDDNYNSGRRGAIRSSMTWTSSIGEPHPQDQDDLEDRTSFAVEYNRLAKKHGVRELLPEDYGLTDLASVSDKPGGWFSRKILRKTSSTQSVKFDKKLKHKRSFSDLSLRLKLKKNSLQDKDLQELVRICGSSLLYLPTEYATSSLSVPTCFRATAQYLVQHAPSTRGVFRISGSHSVVAALYNHYCDMDPEGHLVAGTVRCPTLPEHIKCDVHDVGSAFKRFLSGLPRGILGSLTLFDSLVSIQSQLQGTPEMTRTKQSRIRARLIALSVSSLRSRYRRNLICAVFGLLCMIGRAAEIARREDDKGRPLPTSDLMGYGPLGIVFGPLLVGNMLDNYNMHLANPREGLVLLPVGSPKSKKEKNNGKNTKAKSNATDDGAVFSVQVDKIRVANGITEMLITHWRDVVRHLKSLSTMNMTEGYKIMGVASTKAPFLRTSASESFALRKPPDWDDAKPQGRDLDRSPTPTRQIIGLKGSHSQYFMQSNDALMVRKQRSKTRTSSGKMLAGAALKTVLSPTVEERGLEHSPAKRVSNNLSTVTVERSLDCSAKILAAAALKTAISPTREDRGSGKPSWKIFEERSKANTSRFSGKALATRTSDVAMLPTKEERSTEKSAEGDFVVSSTSGTSHQMLAVSAVKPTIEDTFEDDGVKSSPRQKTFVTSSGVTSQAPSKSIHNPINKSSSAIKYSNIEPGSRRNPIFQTTFDDEHASLHERCAASWKKDILFHVDINSEGFAHIEVQTPSSFDGSKSSKRRLDSKYHTSTPKKDDVGNTTSGLVESTHASSILTAMSPFDIANTAGLHTERDTEATNAHDTRDLGIERSHILDLQQLSPSPTSLSPPKIPARRAFPPIAGVRNYGVVRRFPASEPELRRATSNTATWTSDSHSNEGRRRKAFTAPVQFSTWVDPLAKVSEKEDKASLAALAKVLVSSDPTDSEIAPLSSLRQHFKSGSRNTDVSVNSREHEVYETSSCQRPSAQIVDYVQMSTVARKQQSDSEPSSISRTMRTSTRSSCEKSTPGGSQAEVTPMPQTPQQFKTNNVIQGSGRLVGNVRALAAKFDATKSISPSGPPLSRILTVSSSPGGQDQPEHRRESVVAPYTTNPSSPAKSQKSGTTDKTPVNASTLGRTPMAAAIKGTPSRRLTNSVEEIVSTQSSRKSRETTITLSNNPPKGSPFLPAGTPKAIHSASLSTSTVLLDSGMSFSRSTDTLVLSQNSYKHRDIQKQDLQSVSQRTQMAESEQSVKRSCKQQTEATLRPSDTSNLTSDTCHAMHLLPTYSPGRNSSVLYEQIRQLQQQVRALEAENLLHQQQLEARDSHIVQRLRDKLKDMTSSLQHWKARAESAEKELDIITKLATRCSSSQITKNPLAQQPRETFLPKNETYSYDEAHMGDECSSSSFYGMDGAGSYHQSSESNETVIRDLREAVAGLDYSVWLDRRVFDADPAVPNRLGSIGL